MEHILDLYQQEADPKRPLICFDEKPMQVVGSLREEVPMKPGKPRRIDYEYERHGTCNLLMFFAPLRRNFCGGWRHVAVRERRRRVDFAEARRERSLQRSMGVGWRICRKPPMFSSSQHHLEAET